MKKLLVFGLLLAGMKLNAQTELKLSPIALIFGDVLFSVEQQISESVGVDADVILVGGFYGANLSGKYYFDPTRGIDKFHIGGFAGFQEERLGLGFLVGYKWLSRKNITFELGLGIGRGLGEGGGTLGYGKLHLGYRFQKKTKKQS